MLSGIIANSVAMVTCLREQVIRALSAEPSRLSTRELQHLKLTDVTTNEQRSSGLLTIKRRIQLPNRVVLLNDEVHKLLDEYVNTDDPDERLRPFHDYRPNIGYHLFPSAVTGRSLSSRSFRTLSTAAKVPPHITSPDVTE